MELKNKVVLITGSSIGIGAESAVLFAKEGCKVVVTYNKDKKNGEKVVIECRKHSEAILIHLDVTDEKSIKKALKDSIKAFSRIDILINNAGLITWKYLEKQSLREIDDQIDVNLKGLIKTTSIFLPILLSQKKGIIINIASGAGITAYTELSTYCATKFGVRGFSQALAGELPEQIRVYVVNPGMTATRMTDYQGVDPKEVANVILNTAKERLGKASGDDVDVWEYI
jgi:3-oxoacyl-[acyl-carrier protein] reductase